jgi:hypothetical protein
LSSRKEIWNSSRVVSQAIDSLSVEIEHGVTLLKERRTAPISVTGKIDVRSLAPAATQKLTITDFRRKTGYRAAKVGFDRLSPDPTGFQP